VAALGPQGWPSEPLDAAMGAEATEQAIAETFSKAWLQHHGAVFCITECQRGYGHWRLAPCRSRPC
jgi:hypothetical protein